MRDRNAALQLNPLQASADPVRTRGGRLHANTTIL